jgi:hypothetical protein
MSKILKSAGLLALLSGSFVFAEQRPVSANLLFNFTLAGEQVPAGQYAFSLDEGGDFLHIQAPGRYSAKLLVATRLARSTDAGAVEPRLVFGMDGDERYLSEIWLPNQAGVQLRPLRNGHKQESVDFPGTGAGVPPIVRNPD